MVASRGRDGHDTALIHESCEYSVKTLFVGEVARAVTHRRPRAPRLPLPEHSTPRWHARSTSAPPPSSGSRHSDLHTDTRHHCGYLVGLGFPSSWMAKATQRLELGLDEG